MSDIEDSVTENDSFELDEGDTTIEGEGEDENLDQDPNIKNQEGEDENPKPPADGTTDKGTKLAPDPLSQANQLRANAERKLAQAIEYIDEMKRNAQPPKPAVVEPEEFLDPSKIETVEDLQKFASSLKNVFEKRQADLEGKLQQTAEERATEKTDKFVMSQVEGVQSKYPMFREFNADGSANPEYDPELDKTLSDLYTELDFDPQSKNYRGKVSLMRLAGAMVTMSKRGEGIGSKNAQTQVIDKRGGAIKTNGTPAGTVTDTSKMSAASTISSRISQSMNGRRR